METGHRGGAGVPGMRCMRRDREGPGERKRGKENLRGMHRGGLRTFVNNLLSVTSSRIQLSKGRVK